MYNASQNERVRKLEQAIEHTGSAGAGVSPIHRTFHSEGQKVQVTGTRKEVR